MASFFAVSRPPKLSVRSPVTGLVFLWLAMAAWFSFSPSVVGHNFDCNTSHSPKQLAWCPEKPQEAVPETAGLPAWVVVYPNATLEGPVHTGELQESGYFTLKTNDSAKVAFDFYQLAYAEKVNGTPFTCNFMAYAPGYGELWFTGASNEQVRLAILSAVPRQSSALLRRTTIHISYTRGTTWASPYQYPMNDIGVLTDPDLQPMRFECEINGEDDFFSPHAYLKAIHFTHRGSLTNVTLDFQPLLEAERAYPGDARMAVSDWRQLPPWVTLYPQAKVIAAAADAGRKTGVLILSTEHPQRQVHQFYNERLRELYLQFGFQRVSWSEGEEFSTTDWARDSDTLVGVITLQDKIRQTVVLLRYQGNTVHPVRTHRRTFRRR
ncbi:MAG: hypothetical protein NZ585_12590 [Chloracidobacterium sp.]|nr:hypothetical protein [Chloracidobacterium sp.]MDW8216264.1 hypothetical protein [Acidobacteriota bacterium]